MGMPGSTELLVIVFVILLLFGAKKLPELSRALGKSLGEFRKGQKEGAEPDSDEEKPSLDASKTEEKKEQ